MPPSANKTNANITFAANWLNLSIADLDCCKSIAGLLLPLKETLNDWLCGRSLRQNHLFQVGASTLPLLPPTQPPAQLRQVNHRDRQLAFRFCLLVCAAEPLRSVYLKWRASGLERLAGHFERVRCAGRAPLNRLPRIGRAFRSLKSAEPQQQQHRHLQTPSSCAPVHLRTSNQPEPT